MTRIHAGEIGQPTRIVTVPEPVPFTVPTWEPTSPTELPTTVPQELPAIPAGANR